MRGADAAGAERHLTGGHRGDAEVLHPLEAGRELPLYIANFVLMEYGTGAIFGCPAHDQRDLDFARTFGLPVRVVVAATPARDRAMRVPALGERAARVQAAAEPPPVAGWLLLVDEGPGETWLYLAEEEHPAAVLEGFLGRRGRTDFARARRRSVSLKAGGRWKTSARARTSRSLRYGSAFPGPCGSRRAL